MDDHNAHFKDDAKEDDIESGEEDEPVSQQPLVSSTGREDSKTEPISRIDGKNSCSKQRYALRHRNCSGLVS